MLYPTSSTNLKGYPPLWNAIGAMTSDTWHVRNQTSRVAKYPRITQYPSEKRAINQGSTLNW